MPAAAGCQALPSKPRCPHARLLQALLLLWWVVEDHDTLFILSESVHVIGIGLLAYKLIKKRAAGGATQPATAARALWFWGAGLRHTNPLQSVSSSWGSGECLQRAFCPAPESTAIHLGPTAAARRRLPWPQLPWVQACR